MLESSDTDAHVAAPRRPRIGIMGEFSAGKSTLTNLLMGCDALPVKVTATQLPPVWLSHGTDAPYRVDLDDVSHPVDLDALDAIPVAETRYLRVFREADVLEVCDIIDFPGISDPNMAAEVWQRAADLADAVLWCSHATQAWRQSEAAVWDEMPEALKTQSFLLLTRWDRLADPRDGRRVLARVKRETEGLFAKIFPVSLTQAQAARDDLAAWQSSGAEAFTEALIDLTHQLSENLGEPDFPRRAGPRLSASTRRKPVAGAADVMPEPRAEDLQEPPALRAETPAIMAEPTEPEPSETPRTSAPAPEPTPGVIPRRVKASHGAPRRARLPRDGAAPVLAEPHRK